MEFVPGGKKKSVFAFAKKRLKGAAPLIVFYTDGITEARNEEGELYGEARLLETVNQEKHPSTVELHHKIKDGIVSFVKDAPKATTSPW